MGFLLQMGQEFILQHSSFILALLDEVVSDLFHGGNELLKKQKERPATGRSFCYQTDSEINEPALSEACLTRIMRIK